MSEYQFYEFQAIDRPLSYEDQQYIQSLSSRVKLTATNAQFLYNYGDFRGDPEELLDRCFDIFVYVSNFGVRRLMIRFPKSLVNLKTFEPYCVKYCISVKETVESIILEIYIVQESYYGWLEEKTYIASLLALREDLLKGDLRLLYLAWLAAGFAEEAPAPPEQLIEPPVPANLQKLSLALQAFADLFHIEDDLIAAAAIESPTAKAQTEPIADLIAALPEAERNAYLLRAAQGETHVGAELMRYLRKKFGKSSKTKLTSPGRSLSDLIELANEQRTQRTIKQQNNAVVARQKYLETIASKTDEMWQEVDRLIELKQAKPYETAVSLLVDLRDVAVSQGEFAQFSDRITELKQQYRSRSGLLTRLQKAGL